MGAAQRIAVTSMLAVSAACRLPGPSVPVEPGVIFAAHQEHQRLVIDRTRDGGTGALVPAGWFRRPGAPTFLLERDGEKIAALWVKEVGRVEVRGVRSPQDRRIGRVDPAWEDGAIRLTLTPGDGSPFQVGPFRRTTTGVGPPELTRRAQTVIDVRGTYQADVQDAAGKAVGWWRVKIGPYLPAPRLYDAVLPDQVDLPLAAATAAALGSELDWIEAHVLDVYRGDTSGGLERSIPIGR